MRCREEAHQCFSNNGFTKDIYQDIAFAHARQLVFAVHPAIYIASDIAQEFDRSLDIAAAPNEPNIFTDGSVKSPDLHYVQLSAAGAW